MKYGHISISIFPLQLLPYSSTQLYVFFFLLTHLVQLVLFHIYICVGSPLEHGNPPSWPDFVVVIIIVVVRT